MNEIILMMEIAVVFSLVVLFERLFSKEGLFVWIAMAGIVANIQVGKVFMLFGLEATGGNVMFTSIFLAENILSFKYGAEQAQKALKIGIAAVLVYLLGTQVLLLYKPFIADELQDAIGIVFRVTPRICFASVLMFSLSNVANIFLFSRLKMNSKVKNAITTIGSNCVENFFFALIAFVGLYDFSVILGIAVSTCLIEIFVGLCDAPFYNYAIRKKAKDGRKETDTDKPADI